MLLNIKTSSKKKKKLTKAQEQQKKDFEAMCAKWNSAPKFGPKYTTGPKAKLIEDLARQGLTATARGPSVPERQDLKPLKGKFVQGSTAPVNSTKYTGTRMLGIGQLHKSNAVPVFSQDEAVDISRMRRN